MDCADVATDPRVLLPEHIEPSLPALGAGAGRLDGLCMGTRWQLHWFGATGPRAEANLRALVLREIDLVVAQMSTWEADSDLSRFNRAPVGVRQDLPAPLCQVLDCALQVAATSDGAFDPTVGEVVDAWGFGPGVRFSDPVFCWPTPAVLAAWRAQRPAQPWQAMQFDGQGAQRFAGCKLDLSGIAKGYAVDRVAAALHIAGVESALVDIGGELRGFGLKPDGQPWWVELEMPATVREGSAATRLALHGLSVATSGDHQRCLLNEQGQRLAHTIDPRSAWPAAQGPTLVSVVHEACMWADAWATALMVLDAPAGLTLAERHGLAALWWFRQPDGRLCEQLSPALKALAA